MNVSPPDFVLYLWKEERKNSEVKFGMFACVIRVTICGLRTSRNFLALESFITALSK